MLKKLLKYGWLPFGVTCLTVVAAACPEITKSIILLIAFSMVIAGLGVIMGMIGGTISEELGWFE